MAKIVSAKDIDGNSHKLDVSELRWRPSAYGIVIKDGKLLVSPEFDGYDLPGGGLKLGELPEEAVVREVWEETGIKVSNPRPLTFKSSFFVLPESKTSTKGRSIQSILMYLVCDFAGGELSDTGFDEDEKVHSRFPEWLPLDQLDNIHVTTSFDWRDLVREVAKDL